MFSFKAFLEETIPMGLCFPYAQKLAMDMLEDGVFTEKDIFVCHGEVEEPLALNPKRYIHAWVETKDRVYDWQMMTAKTGSIYKEAFYKLYKPSNVSKYTVKQSIENCLKSNHHGPWD